MSVMKRGANANLTREIPGLKGLVLGVRWSTGAEKGLADNLVLATILCSADGKALSEEHFVFFNQLSEPSMSVRQLTEALDDDAEQVEVEFAAVPAEVSRIVVAIYINQAPGTARGLGQLRDLVVRVLDPANNRELVRSENMATAVSGESAMALGEVYRHSNGWKFRVIGESYRTGIVGLAEDYGVPM